MMITLTNSMGLKFALSQDNVLASSCVFCNNWITFDIPMLGVVFMQKWDEWVIGCDNGHGPKAQDAFPSLTPDAREFMMSGICPECWDRMFPNPE